MSKLPAMSPPPNGVGVEKAHLEYFDGTTREVFITDAQYNVPNSMMIVSRTDKEGIITHVNVDFLDASGYDKEELIGMPQYILRHPHMPKAAFRDLWQTVQRGETWSGAVKNLRKDGGYYWVQAVVKPVTDEQDNIIGYHSVRKRIDKAKIAEHEALYAQMRAEE